MGKMTLMTALTLNAAGFSDGVNDAIKETKEFNLAIAGASKETIKAFKDISTMGIGEMKKNLMELKKISFAGKTKEEIGVINQRIGDLSDSMGDLRSQQKMMGTEFGTAMAGGLQTISAVAEGLVGVASLFGASKEQAEKYQQVMVSLIGITQAMGVVQDAMATRQFQNIGLKIKETAVTLAQAVATKVATAAEWLLNASLLTTAAIIGSAVIVVAALAAGMYYLYSWITKTTAAEEKQQQAIKDSNEERLRSKKIIEEVGEAAYKTLVPQKVHVDNLVKSIQSENTSLADKKKMLNELIQLDPKYLNGLNLANISTEKGKGIITNYINALSKKAEAMALESQLVKLYSDKYTDELNYQNLLIGIQAEKIMLTNGLKNMTFGFGEAEDLRDKIKLEEQLAATTKGRIDGAIKGIGNLETKLSKIKPVDVSFNTGGAGGSTSKTENKNPFADMPAAESGNAYTEFLQGMANDSKKTNDELSKLRDERDDEDMKALEEQSEKISAEIAQRNKKIISMELSKSKKIRTIDKLTSQEGLMAMAGSLDSMAGLFNEQTAAYKAMAIASVIISSIAASMAALAPPPMGYGPVVGAVMTAGIVAGGVASIAKIAGVKGFALGGIVGGNSYSGDLVPARVNSGEMILNKSQQSNLFAMANGMGGSGGGEVEFKIRGTELVGVLTNYNKKVNNTR